MLPAEIQPLNLQYIKRISANEFSAACPKCGGAPHLSGEFPDRFRVWMRSKVTGGLFGWCRRCGYIWTPKGEKFTPEQARDWEEEQRQIEVERQAKKVQALELLRSGRLWEKYHDNLTDQLRFNYRLRGITDFWIDYWMLGYNPAKVIWSGEREYTTPALTIPIYLPGEELPISIRNRLLDPLNPMDKYRPEFAGLASSLFFADRDNKPGKRVLIVEGEFKAMTVYITLDDPNFGVVGIPGKRPSSELFEALGGCEQVYLLLDPDAYEKQAKEQTTAIRRLIDLFKERSRVIQLPYKVDDMINDGSLNKEGLYYLVKNARRFYKKGG